MLASNGASLVSGPCGGARRGPAGCRRALVQCARIGISHICAEALGRAAAFCQNFGLSWMAAWKPRHHGPTSMAPWASPPGISGAKRPGALAQRCGHACCDVWPRRRAAAYSFGVAVVDGGPGHAEQRTEPSERLVGGLARRRWRRQNRRAWRCRQATGLRMRGARSQRSSSSSGIGGRTAPDAAGAGSAPRRVMPRLSCPGRRGPPSIPMATVRAVGGSWFGPRRCGSSTSVSQLSGSTPFRPRRGEKRGEDGPMVQRAAFGPGEEITVPALGNRPHHACSTVGWGRLPRVRRSGNIVRPSQCPIV